MLAREPCTSERFSAMSESPREPKSLELRPRNCRWLTGEENWLTSLLRGENSDGEAAATAGDGVEASTGARRMATRVGVLVLHAGKFWRPRNA